MCNALAFKFRLSGLNEQQHCVIREVDTVCALLFECECKFTYELPLDSKIIAECVWQDNVRSVSAQQLPGWLSRLDVCSNDTWAPLEQSPWDLDATRWARTAEDAESQTMAMSRTSMCWSAVIRAGGLWVGNGNRRVGSE